MSLEQQASGAGSEYAPGQLDLLGGLSFESILDQGPRVGGGGFERLISSRTVGEALLCCFGTTTVDTSTAVSRLTWYIGHLDQLISDQVNEIIHHHHFRKLEASWRGLRYLVGLAGELADEEDIDRGGIEVRVLNLSLRDLNRDFERASEFDQSHLFRQVYTQEFGTPGGTPFGMLIADYEFEAFPRRNGPPKKAEAMTSDSSNGHLGRPDESDDFPYDGLEILRSMAAVGAAAFCPVITSVGPEFFDLKSFDELDRMTGSLDRLFDKNRDNRYIKLQSLRDSEDSRFLGLTLPRVLMRRPWDPDFDSRWVGRNEAEATGFRFQEQVRGRDRSKYLWANAGYAFGEVVLRAYAQSGWLADIRGVMRNIKGGGLVTGLPFESLGTDRDGVAIKNSTEVVVTDRQERELAQAGFLPVCDCHDTEFSAFYSNQSFQRPKSYSGDAGTMNARMSSMLQYILCASQFARYVKCIARDKIGTHTDPDSMRDFLDDWIKQYVTDDGDASRDAKARMPLRKAEILVRSRAGEPGVMDCEMFFQPHYELDDMATSVRVKTEFQKSGG